MLYDAARAGPRLSNARADLASGIMEDPFNLAEQAVEHGAEVSEWAETGKGEQEPDPDWHVPYLLNEEARLLAYHFEERIKAPDFQPRSAGERSALELERYKMFCLIHEHLTEKYRAASRTLDLLRKVQAGKSGFVLLLWGFGSKTWHLDGASVSNIDIGAPLERDALAGKLAPAPLLWIADPTDSGAFKAASADNLSKIEASFRIESGRDWEKNVCLLISAASFIIVKNAGMTQGVVREIERVKEMGRLSDTFFDAPEKAQHICHGHDLKPLTEDNIALMRNEAAARVVPGKPLPEPTCLWIEGEKRKNLFSAFLDLFRHLEAGGRYRTPIPFDWLLDADYKLLSYAVLLERLDLLAAVLKWLCEMFAATPGEEFPHGESLAKAYGPLQNKYQSILEKISQEQPLTAQLEETYRYLRAHPPE